MAIQRRKNAQCSRRGEKWVLISLEMREYVAWKRKQINKEEHVHTQFTKVLMMRPNSTTVSIIIDNRNNIAFEHFVPLSDIAAANI